jgi:hypothetical protein
VSQDLYSCADANGLPKFIDELNFEFTGTWSMYGTYYADPAQAVVYGNSRYLCVTDNVGKIPTTLPKKFNPIRYWSSLVLVRASGTATPDATDIALAAYTLAQTGTVTANAVTRTLSTGFAGTVTFWASGTQGGAADVQVTVIKGIVTNIV